MAFAALFDPLFCPEEHLDLYQDEPGQDHEFWPVEHHPAVFDDELPALFESLRSKEAPPPGGRADEEDGYGGAAGREAAVGWASQAAARLGFSALTAALAAAYLDRCFLGGATALRLGEPWMARLAAVACVALAAKVEETHVPLLVDLQLRAAGSDDEPFVFDAETVRRMELFVLSALQWRMHPVTPFSYLDPLLAGVAMRRHQCDTVLLAVMAGQCRLLHFPSQQRCDFYSPASNVLHFRDKDVIFISRPAIPRQRCDFYTCKNGRLEVASAPAVILGRRRVARHGWQRRR